MVQAMNFPSGIKKNRVRLAALIMSLGFSNFAAAGVIALSSSFELDARSSAESYGTLVGENSILSQGSAINALNPAAVVATAISSSPYGPSVVNTYAAGSAFWNSTADGTVLFDDIGWRQTIAPNQASSSGTHFGTEWNYQFIADVTGTFTLDYDITIDPETTNPFGLLGFGFSLDYVNHFAAGTSGTATRNIVAGDTYEVSIYSRAGISGGATKTALMDGVFNWSMDTGPAPVSEPAPLALLMSGLILLSLQRKKIVALRKK